MGRRVAAKRLCWAGDGVTQSGKVYKSMVKHKLEHFVTLPCTISVMTEQVSNLVFYTQSTSTVRMSVMTEVYM